MPGQQGLHVPVGMRHSHIVARPIVHWHTPSRHCACQNFVPPMQVVEQVPSFDDELQFAPFGGTQPEPSHATSGGASGPASKVPASGVAETGRVPTVPGATPSVGGRSTFGPVLVGVAVAVLVGAGWEITGEFDESAALHPTMMPNAAVARHEASARWCMPGNVTTAAAARNAPMGERSSGVGRAGVEAFRAAARARRIRP